MNANISRRVALAALAASVAGAATSMPDLAFAQAAGAWPNRPIRWVIPYAAGGTSDILARDVAQKIGERLGQPVVIDNKSGAGGNLGTDFVAKSPPDGYTWVLGNIGPMAVNASMYRSLPFDPEKDLVPITLLVAYSNVVVANLDSGPKTVKELLERARKQSVPYAGNGVGTSLHLTGELLARSAGVKLQHVAYRGEAPGLTDVMAGVVPIGISPMASALPLVKGGRVRALAVTGAERSTLLPDVPTLAESGLPGFEVTGWVGILVPRGTPEPIVKRLVTEFTAIMQMQEVKNLVNDTMASFVPPLGPEYFAKFIHSETAKWREVVLGANLKAD
ncbi:MAG: tripartite tricarboxylate transporter substrate binding protein [Variovorax sp.]|nr:MAG: tripartite tricarboxylate transporter substrate binding protein [Variovorax sp.]